MTRLFTTSLLLVTASLSYSCGGAIGPPGPQGPMGTDGVDGTNGSPDTDSQVLAKLNNSVRAGGQVVLGNVGYSDPKYDLRWALLNSIATSACAASGGFGAFPYPTGTTCTAACSANTAGLYTTCVAMFTALQVQVTQPTSRNQAVGASIKYTCSDVNKGPDPSLSSTTPDSAAYCCCK